MRGQEAAGPPTPWGHRGPLRSAAGASRPMNRLCPMRTACPPGSLFTAGVCACARAVGGARGQRASRGPVPAGDRCAHWPHPRAAGSRAGSAVSSRGRSFCGSFAWARVPAAGFLGVCPRAHGGFLRSLFSVPRLKSGNRTFSLPLRRELGAVTQGGPGMPPAGGSCWGPY